jgi:hypothetical protein
MNPLLFETLICAGAASAGTCLIGAWWHRRRTRWMVAHIARLQAELDRVHAARSSPARADLGMRFDAPSTRPSTAIQPTVQSQRRRLWSTMRARVRSLGSRRAASLSKALPFLDTVATTRHTASSTDPN